MGNISSDLYFHCRLLCLLAKEPLGIVSSFLLEIVYCHTTWQFIRLYGSLPLHQTESLQTQIKIQKIHWVMQASGYRLTQYGKNFYNLNKLVACSYFVCLHNCVTTQEWKYQIIFPTLHKEFYRLVALCSFLTNLGKQFESFLQL